LEKAFKLTKTRGVYLLFYTVRDRHLYNNYLFIKTLYAMRETPQFPYIFVYMVNVVGNYLLNLNLIVKMLSTFLLFFINYGLSSTLIKGWGQSAWLEIDLLFTNHQRLNVEQPKNKEIMHDHSTFVNRSKFYNNKEEFYH
jgi:hypothetical protein